MKFEIGLHKKNFHPGPLFIERIIPKLPDDVTVYWIDFDGSFVKVMTSNGRYIFSATGESWGLDQS